MRKFRFVSLYLWIFASLYLFLSPPPVFAQPLPWDQIIGNPNPALNPSESKCYVVVNGENIPTVQGFECVVYNVSTVIVPFVGLAIFVMLIIGSFKLMTSGGEPKQIQAAWKTITFAIVGLVLVLCVWFFLTFITDFFKLGGDIKRFEVPMWEM